MDRILDKRKAREKETDDDSSDVSLNKNPTKRARVDYSSSPKEKSPSPASAQRSPMGKQPVLDSGTAATPTSSKDPKSDNNGDLTMTPSVISKFDLPSPFTTQELEQMGKSNEGKEDSDSDNGSTKFYADILQREENKRKQGKANTSPSKNEGSRNGASATNSKRNNNKSSNNSNSSRPSPRPKITSSPNSDLSLNMSQTTDVEVTIKITDPVTHQVYLEETVLKSDSQKVDAFLRQHNMKLSMSSQGSGYMGDISSLESSSGAVQGPSKSNRWTISSLGSTIPRQSIVSIVTNTSDSPEEGMKRPGRPPLFSKSRKRSDGPIASSTKIEDSSMSSSSSKLDRMNVSSKNPMSNGDEYSASSVSSRTSQSPRKADSVSPKKPKPSPSKLDRGEGVAKTPSYASNPGGSRKSKGTLKSSGVSTPGGESSETLSAADSEVGRSGKKPASRRRGGSASNFPITTTETPAELSAVLNTPPPVRSVAKIEGTSAKPLTRFEAEMNNEPVIEADLEKAKTLWSTIVQGELVFARWRDKNYYSGMVKNKGHNDTWIIDFDDGMEDVASESHIVPIRILGVGVKGIYSPDTGYEPYTAVVIGQKFGIDLETPGKTIVKYAIRRQGAGDMIWCSRRQLSIKEADAKKLRSEYQPPVAAKAGDVSLDNIVSGPRRRTRGGESENISENRLVAGASDGRDKGESSSTPKPRGRPGPKPGKNTPASEAKKKRQANSGTVSVSRDTSTSSSPGKDSTKESPTRSQKPTVEFGKKRNKKTLFQGMQFFLTASGGGDPGISGNHLAPPIPYDKDEYREFIENCGGVVLDNVGDEAKENVFLISDSYARTVKYIYCLAAGIPCISHSWIKTCIDGHEILDWKIFQLPAGWSLENQDLVPHHDRKPLKGCKIFVTSESDQLYNYWKPVLTAAEATLLKPSKKKGTTIPAGTEVVVTDNHVDSTKEVLDEAGKHNLPVVKPEWLVQTIITGEKAHMYGHDKYKVLFNETESEETEGGGTEGDSSHFNDVLADMQNPD